MKFFSSITCLATIKKYSVNLLLSFLFFISNDIFSQTDSLDIYDLNLTQLSKLKISSASKAVQNINEVPSTIFIITAANIKERGCFTLEEALSDLPGFQFRNKLGMNSYVFQRGIPNQNNLALVLVDGLQINELNSGGFYGGGQYNLSNVERIEVVYGPASVVYGTNAVSGIINIITKNANEKQAGINVLVGNFNTSESDFIYRNVNKKKTLGIAVSGMLKMSDKANLKGEAGEFVPEISKHCGNASITYYFNEHLKLNLHANYIGKRKNPKIIQTTNSEYVDACLVFNRELSLMEYNGFTVQVILKNILNEEYYHTSNRDTDRYRQPQRTLMLSVSYVLNY